MATPLPPRTSRADSTGNHILVVDDEPFTVHALCELLALEGYRTTGVYSGEEAQKVLEASVDPATAAVDLVILDRSMPVMSGLEVCSWIKEHPQLDHIPVLMLTAMATIHDKIEGLDTGADDYVTKPYHTEELLARIQALLRSSRIEQELYRRNQQLAALNQIVSAITTSIQVGEIHNNTLHGIETLLGVEAGSLSLLDRDDETLLRRRAFGHGREWTAEQRVSVDGLLGHVLHSRRPLRVNDVAHDSRYCPAKDNPDDLTIQSALMVPLMVKEQLIGVIEAFNREGGFSRSDLNLLRSLAAAVAIALENAHLFADLQANQRRLQATASTLQALFDGITDSLYIIDRQWRLIAVNQSCARQAEATPASLISQVCHRALYGRSAPCPNCQVGETLQRRQGVGWVERRRSPDGEFAEWELYTYPIIDRTGQVRRVIVLRREVTEQRRLEASLAQAEKLAAIGQLAAGVAHEINNPLTAIIANAQFLTEDLSPDEDAYQSAELIARAGERTARVVRRLLDFARQEEVEHQRVDINASLREAMVLLDHQLSKAVVEVVTRLEPNLPSVTANADEIQNIWLNLLVNAKDALAGQAGVRRIEVLSRQQGDQIEVSVTDNGPGIPTEQLPYLFHPFYTTKSPEQGTGLGLSTSYRVVEQLGGRIDIISEPGQGTTVTVVLPVVQR